jgi:hypothetical protein
MGEVDSQVGEFSSAIYRKQIVIALAEKEMVMNEF